MLKRVGGEIDPEGAVTTIGEADFPVPFPTGLEFNSPAHGNWNIVHTGMLMPEAIQIYVCADNCMRGVVLTAAEMNAAERFSFVIVEEENLLNGNLEDVTIEGVTDVLKKLEKKPKAVLLFTVCLHHFLGCDLELVYGELEARFPEIVFVRCYMDPIMQKHGATPDQKLRKAMYDPLTAGHIDKKTVTLVGSDFVLDKNSDIKRLLKNKGYTLREIPACKNWEEYQCLGAGEFFISCYPPAKYGAEMLAERLNRKHLYNKNVKANYCDKRTRCRRTAQRSFHCFTRRQKPGGTPKRRKKHFLLCGQHVFGTCQEIDAGPECLLRGCRLRERCFSSLSGLRSSI